VRGEPVRSDMFSWPGTPKEPTAFDFSNEPPVHSFNCIKPIRQIMMDSTPHVVRKDGRTVPKFDNLYVPMAYSGDPFWRMGCKNGFLNHSYTPFIAMLYTIKCQSDWLMSELSGMIVTKEDFVQIRMEFNDLFSKLRENRGAGRHGSASEDEFFRLGYLFFVLAETSDSSLGLMISAFGEFNNPWIGSDSYSFSALKISTIRHWSLKLQDVVLSDLNWKAFYFRHLGKSDDHSFWFFNFPTLDPFTFNHMMEAKTDDFFEFVLSYLKTLSSRGVRTMITVPASTQRMTDIFKRLDLAPSDNFMRNNDIIVQPVETIDCVESFRLIITNYFPSHNKAFEMVAK